MKHLKTFEDFVNEGKKSEPVNEISHSAEDVDFRAIEKSIMKVGHDNKAQSEFKKKLYSAVSDLLNDAPDDMEVTLKFMWTVLNELKHSDIYKRR